MVPYQLILQTKSSAILFSHWPPLSSHNCPPRTPLSKQDWSPPASNTQSSLFHLSLFPGAALSRRASLFPLFFLPLSSLPASVSTHEVCVLCAESTVLGAKETVNQIGILSPDAQKLSHIDPGNRIYANMLEVF